jgi:hypothetical protein
LRKIQYVSKYLALAEEGLVSKLECPMDQGLLLPNMNLQDEIFLYCNSCGYKRFLGYTAYSEIESEAKKYV